MAKSLTSENIRDVWNHHGCEDKRRTGVRAHAQAAMDDKSQVISSSSCDHKRRRCTIIVFHQHCRSDSSISCLTAGEHATQACTPTHVTEPPCVAHAIISTFNTAEIHFSFSPREKILTDVCVCVRERLRGNCGDTRSVRAGKEKLTQRSY